MDGDKPGLKMIRLFNDLADLRVALREAGMAEDGIRRICGAVADARLCPPSAHGLPVDPGGARGPSGGASDREADWFEGRWMKREEDFE